MTAYGWARPERKLAQASGVPSFVQMATISVVFWIIGAIVMGSRGKFQEYLAYDFWWILLITLVMFELALEWGEHLMELGLL